MNIKAITILFSLSVFAITASAQYHEAPIRTEPVETTFTQDSVLFSELLSEFATRCQQYDTLYDVVWLNNPNKVPINVRYEKILPTMPLFEIYPAFRIDCPDGYVLGIFYVLRIYNDKTKRITYATYLDILSYTHIGRMISKLSFALDYLNTYLMEDSEKYYEYQLMGVADIMNGEIHYGYDQRRAVNRELTTHSESTYIYKIQDDATLKLLSEKHQQE
ncbi:MAG: hypothetical protein J6X58_04100 [Bacteroidales bacterium]|nr:hypothetical protein [Bacteroidales bacterium]